MSSHHFWLSEAQFSKLQPLLPNKVRGVARVDDRREISGIIHVLRGGLMWRDAPKEYGPHKTLYNRFIRWSEAGVFNQIFATLAAESQAIGVVMIDATHLKAHRTAASLFKKGLFPAASDAPRADCLRSWRKAPIQTACCVRRGWKALGSGAQRGTGQRR